MKKHTVVVIDDHPTVRAGIGVALNAEPDLMVVAESNGKGAVQFILDHNPEIVLLDIQIGDRSGIDVLSQIKQKRPRIPVLMVSMYATDRYVDAAISAGATGYITKQADAKTLVAAVRAVLNGCFVWDAPIAELIRKRAEEHQSLSHTTVSAYDTLTMREQQVFRYLAQGLSTKEAARELKIAYRTVANYQTTIYQKLELSSSTQLVRLAMQLGII